jgi:hypothetical protein
MGTPITQQGKGKGAHLTLYIMQGNLQTDEFKDKRLWMVTENGQPTYYSIDYGRLGEGDPATTPVSTTEEKTGKKKAIWWYDFVVPCNDPRVVVLRHSEMNWRQNLAKRKQFNQQATKKDRKIRGHSSVAGQGAPVYFAGEILFREPGVLARWTNKTGHYYVGAQIEFSEADLLQHVEQQTGLVLDMNGVRLLPMDKFERWNGDI